MTQSFLPTHREVTLRQGARSAIRRSAGGTGGTTTLPEGGVHG